MRLGKGTKSFNLLHSDTCKTSRYPKTGIAGDSSSTICLSIGNLDNTSIFKCASDPEYFKCASGQLMKDTISSNKESLKTSFSRLGNYYRKSDGKTAHSTGKPITSITFRLQNNSGWNLSRHISFRMSHSTFNTSNLWLATYETQNNIKEWKKKSCATPLKNN